MPWIQRLAWTWSTGATLIALTACGADHGDADGPLAQTQQAQKAQGPVGCSGTGAFSGVPGTFVDHCLIQGGTSVICTSGTSMCCRATSDGGRECTDDPDDFAHETVGDSGGETFDTVKDDEAPSAAPGDQPVLNVAPDGSTAKTVEGRYLACLDGCTTSYCRWDCGCRILQGKDQWSCDRENPYIDYLETPPAPPTPPADPAPDTVK